MVKIGKEIDKMATHCCKNCSHCDVLDFYCYQKYKEIQMDEGADCAEFEPYDG